MAVGRSLLLALLLWGCNYSLGAAEWAAIQERGFLTIGVSSHNPPLAYRDQQGKLVGYEIDLAEELGLRLLGSKDRVKLVPLKHTDRLPALWQGAVDMVIAQMTVTGNRQRLVVFSPSYYTDRTVILHRKELNLSELLRPRIAVLQSSSNISVLQMTLPQAQPIAIHTYQEGFLALAARKVDGMILDQVASLSWLQQNPRFTAYPTPHFQSLAIALPQGLQYTELRQRVTNTIEVLKTQGWLTERQRFWNLLPRDKSNTDSNVGVPSP
ncbi:MAG: transporter substrate-binding domain-containing protein [Pseudanabaenaceae cyanobacterium SKYGB_i_bin29]|nr:transporter substrate-binding domain-containing protein [Pseudanabaenaceae cyanobacterium SKYG29]MDW8421665.1 transporter substrate-binding domain-containing protein [Pseudanabaenaceae cyanobacterium SKYGB_i_bin29]